MTTEREYQEGRRRIKKQRRQEKKSNNLVFWFLAGLAVFIGLITVQSNQNLSPQNRSSDQNQIY
ncbi:hypothetical protein [Crocosphaera sp. Alani8]|uniref:hypothetical protein n=1 Tax=Crocosphaera sp. Alani8 TaxID=3038952 RepID=UPI00313D8D41